MSQSCGIRQQRSELWTKWRGLVSEQSQSGQTVAAFCHERGLRDSLFYDWKKRLREGEAVQFVEVKVKESVEQRRPAPNLRVIFHGKYAVYYLPQIDEIVIIRVLHGSRDIASIAEEDGFAI